MGSGKNTRGVYEVKFLAIREHDLEVVVVYRSTVDGTIWTRPAWEFIERFEDAWPRGDK